ncbi:MAG: hypothetical protein Q9204_008325, partial [Flavoplaca sp. TL-2023a]
IESLEDLAHSYHWGLSLAKDGEIIHKLFQLLLPTQLSLEIRSLATLVFGTAIHNNEAALTAALSHFYNDEWPEGPLEAVIMALLHEQSPLLLNRMLFLLSSLCQDQTQLQKFLEAGGMDLLIKTYQAEPTAVDDRDRLRKKVTHFVLDHLLPTAETGDTDIPNGNDGIEEEPDPDTDKIFRIAEEIWLSDYKPICVPSYGFARLSISRSLYGLNPGISNMARRLYGFRLTLSLSIHLVQARLNLWAGSGPMSNN